MAAIVSWPLASRKSNQLLMGVLVSPPGMVETPRLQAKRRFLKSPKGTRDKLSSD